MASFNFVFNQRVSRKVVGKKLKSFLTRRQVTHPILGCESSQYDTPDKNKTNCVATVIHGLIEIQKARDYLKSKGITLTYAECHKLGIPFDRPCPTDQEDPFYDEHCKDADVITAEILEIDIRDGTQAFPKLFVPRNDRSVFNSGFVRCPERVSKKLKSLS